MESMRDINRVMEREIAKGSCPLKLDHIEFGDYSYQEITSKEKLLEVLSYLLRKCSIISTLTNVRPLTWPAVLVSPVCEFCLAASVTMEADLPEMTGRFGPDIWEAQ